MIEVSEVWGGACDFCFLLFAAILLVENDLVIEHLAVKYGFF